MLETFAEQGGDVATCFAALALFLLAGFVILRLPVKAVYRAIALLFGTGLGVGLMFGYLIWGGY